MDVARRELIGLDVVVHSAHAGWDGLSGRVVDETKHMFLVESASRVVKQVPKSGQRFAFRVGTERIVVDGNEIAFQPEDRTKKVRG